MRHITIEFDDETMRQLEAAARARHIDPARMSMEQLLKLLTAGKKPKWRPGLSARRHQMALRTAQPVVDAKVEALRLSEPIENGAVASNTQALDERPAEAIRASRLQLLKQTEGLWKDAPGKPQDGLAYQLEVRAEWP